jgi:hypothetical protein
MWAPCINAVYLLSYRVTRAIHFLLVGRGVGQDTSALLAQRSHIEL